MNNIAKIQSKLQKIKQTVENLNAQLENLEEQLKQISIQNKDSRRVNKGEMYYTIVRNYEFGDLAVCQEKEEYNYYNNNHFSNGNYFATKSRAQEVSDKMNFILQLEKLHDESCPDYTPD